MPSLTLREWSPTPFDPLGIGPDPLLNWLVAPCERTRDSDALDRSNFTACLARLGGESPTCQVLHYRHWGPGWVEIVVVSPERSAEIEQIAAALADYPVLDDAAYAEEEYNDAQDAWSEMSLRERIEAVTAAGHCRFTARRSNPWDIDTDFASSLVRN